MRRLAKNPEPVAEPGRSARKRQAITEAGTALFLSSGYQGTSMDQIAARAGVSKQTVYKNFDDKQELFTQIVLSTLDQANTSFFEELAALPDTGDLEKDLVELATGYLGIVTQEPIVQLRRLVIGEANRLPELARTFYEHAPARTLAAIADSFARLADRGLLELDDPAFAAEHFAALIVSRPIDQALFCGGRHALVAADPTAYAKAGVRVFLAGYRRE